MKQKEIPNWWSITIIILSWLILINPIIHPYPYLTHDGERHFERVVELNNSFKHSPFGSQWLPHLADGYGLPVFFFYPPIFFYICASLSTFGIPDPQVYEFVLALTMLLSGLSMYVCARSIMPKIASTVSAVAYMAAPFHLVDFYTTGSCGQITSYVFIPLFIRFFISAINDGQWKYIVSAALCLAASLLSYHITTLMLLTISPIILLISTGSINKENKLFYSVKNYSIIVIMGLSLSAFYWLPLIVEGRNLRFDDVTTGFANFNNHFLFLHEIFERDVTGDNYPSINNPMRGMSFQVGLPYLFVLVAALLFYSKERNKRILIISKCYQGITLFSLICLFSISKPIWEWIPSMSLILFPWRFLFFVSIATSFLSGLVLWQGTRYRYWSLSTASTVALVLFTWYGTTCQKTNHDYKLLDCTPGKIIASGSRSCAAPGTEFVPNTIKEFPSDAYPEKFNFLSGSGSIESVKIWPERYEAVITAQSDCRVAIDTFWFPGWTLLVDGTRHEIDIKPMFGTMEFDLPAGRHSIELALRGTWPRWLGWIVSVFSAICLVTICYRCNRARAKNALKWIGFGIVIVIVFRAPWAAYPPEIARAIEFNGIENRHRVENCVKVDLFAGDSWDDKRRAGTYYVESKLVFPFQTSVSGRNFSARFSADLPITEAGLYEFRLEADNGAWLAIDDRVVTKFSSLGTGAREGRMPLNSGDHRLRVYYHNVHETGALSIQWKKPADIDWMPIDSLSVSVPDDEFEFVRNEPWNEILNSPPNSL